METEIQTSQECNVGGIDKVVRIGLGTGLIALGLFVPMKKWMGFLVETVGIASTATGIASYCPMSKMLGRNTCRIREQPG